MFDLGFSEILLVVIVALVVLGPKRMPQLVRQVGRWAGKARAMARQFREQLEAEVDLDDLNASGKSSRTATSTPAPIPELTGAPIAGNEPATDEGGTYPYGAYPYAAAPTDATPAATPQPGDDSYSHAHAAGDAPMPYYPPEAEGFNDAPPPVALDAPLHPDHATPIAADEPAAVNNSTAQPKDSSAA